MSQAPDLAAEKAEITKVIENSIGWAATKDTTLLYGCFAHDEELFWFAPRDDGTMHGFESFKKLTEGFFMQEEFKAVGFEVRELQINLSSSGDVAWYHARLDDYNEWDGQPANWEDVRWTGVLEKRDGRWQIVQMHFSSPTDLAESG
jgi:ketosteroid isomerase-like protein